MPLSQAQPGRHICAACAFEDGLLNGLNCLEKKTDLSHLPDSQAGTVRHIDAMSLYNLGYSIGLKIQNLDMKNLQKLLLFMSSMSSS